MPNQMTCLGRGVEIAPSLVDDKDMIRRRGLQLHETVLRLLPGAVPRVIGYGIYCVRVSIFSFRVQYLSFFW